MSKHSNRMSVTTRERIADRQRDALRAHAAANATVTEEKAPKAKKERLSQKDRFAATLTRIGQQATKLASKLDAATNPEKVIVLAGVSDAAHAASARFSQLPADWSPRARKSHGCPKLHRRVSGQCARQEARAGGRHPRRGRGRTGTRAPGRADGREDRRQDGQAGHSEWRYSGRPEGVVPLRQEDVVETEATGSTRCPQQPI